MIVGIDSYHDSSKKGRSVGGVIASMNQSLTRYYSRCTFQTSMQELLDGLKVCIKGALQLTAVLGDTADQSNSGYFVMDIFGQDYMDIKHHYCKSLGRDIELGIVEEHWVGT